MSSTRVLGISVNCTIGSQYQRIDDNVNPIGILDNLSYTGLKYSFTNGHTTNECNQVAHFQSTLNNATEYWNLDSGNVYDSFENLLNFDSVKLLIIRNTNDPIATPRDFLEVKFKNEHYYIGPSGARLIVEPYGPGIAAIVSSASHEEGTISVTANGLITYDFIICGSDQQSSSGL